MSISPKKPLKNKLIIILGPTSSGKSDLAVKLAKKLNGEVISADSRQVYKGLDLTSGKITPKEMASVPHHLLDVVSLQKTFTVSDFKKLGQSAIKDILSRRKLPIICGGTAFYIDALIYNQSFPEVLPNKALRQKLSQQSTESLFKQLKKLDPARAKTIDPKNKVRLIRALEIILTTNSPVPALKKQSPYQVLKIGIKKDPTELKQRIHTRILKRIKQGMIKEIENLHQKKRISWRRLEELGLECRYLSLHLQNKLTKSEMLQKLETETNHYAKRQLTWWKGDSDIHWIQKENEALRLAQDFLN